MIRSVTLDTLSQLKHQLLQLTETQYCTKLDVFNGSAIGSHTRHIIEFYQCLLKGHTTGLVNYDTRERNMDLETSLQTALSTTQALYVAFEAFETHETPLQLQVQFAGLEAFAPSDFAREEVYLIEHSIHHFALIRIGLQVAFPTVPIAPEFGYAHSTITYRNQLNSETCVY